MTEIEQRLIEAARNGTWLECSEPDDGGLRITGDNEDGAIRLIGAQVAGTATWGSRTFVSRRW